VACAFTAPTFESALLLIFVLRPCWWGRGGGWLCKQERGNGLFPFPFPHARTRACVFCCLRTRSSTHTLDRPFRPLTLAMLPRAGAGASGPAKRPPPSRDDDDDDDDDGFDAAAFAALDGDGDAEEMAACGIDDSEVLAEFEALGGGGGGGGGASSSSAARSGGGGHPPPARRDRRISPKSAAAAAAAAAVDGDDEEDEDVDLEGLASKATFGEEDMNDAGLLAEFASLGGGGGGTATTRAAARPVSAAPALPAGRTASSVAQVGVAGAGVPRGAAASASSPLSPKSAALVQRLRETQTQIAGKIDMVKVRRSRHVSLRTHTRSAHPIPSTDTAFSTTEGAAPPHAAALPSRCPTLDPGAPRTSTLRGALDDGTVRFFRSGGSRLRLSLRPDVPLLTLQPACLADRHIFVSPEPIPSSRASNPTHARPLPFPSLSTT
jgi:hypothetical protein